MSRSQRKHLTSQSISLGGTFRGQTSHQQLNSLQGAPTLQPVIQGQLFNALSHRSRVPRAAGVTHLGPGRCSTGSWRGAGSCPTGHWAGGEASDCLGHGKDRDHHQLLSTEPAESHPRAPKNPSTGGRRPQRGRTAASGDIRPGQWHCWVTNTSHTNKGAQGISASTRCCQWAAPPCWAPQLSPSRAREGGAYLGLQQVRGDQSGTEQRWLEIRLARGRVL